MKQQMKLKESGSFFNWLYANNETIPVVNKGATELLWSDRHAYEVLEVDEKNKTCVIDRYIPERTDDNGYFTESQDYAYKKLQGNPETLKYRNGAWRKVTEMIMFTDETDQEYMQLGFDKFWEKYGGILDDEHGRLKLVEGKTYIKRKYPKINIIFGMKKEYRDPHF